jgi:hypothetical protein
MEREIGLRGFAAKKGRFLSPGVTKIVISLPLFEGEKERMSIFKGWRGVYDGMMFAR